MEAEPTDPSPWELNRETLGKPYPEIQSCQRLIGPRDPTNRAGDCDGATSLTVTPARNLWSLAAHDQFPTLRYRDESWRNREDSYWAFKATVCFVGFSVFEANFSRCP